MPRKRKEPEEGGIRCVCGSQDEAKRRGSDPFLVRCEGCGCWQHGGCVGLSARDTPDQYWCESCRPDLHEIKVRNGRATSKFGGSELGDAFDDGRDRRTKRRRTMNSREDEILQRVLEQSAREEQLRQAKLRGEQGGAGDANGDASGAQGDAPSGDAQGDAKGDAPAGDEDSAQHEPTKEEQDSHSPKQESPDPAASPAPSPPAKPKAAPRKRKAAAPRRKAGGAAGAGTSAGSGSASAGVPVISGAGGKKMRPKIPSPRISFYEMRKRIVTILEFAAASQSEMTLEHEARKEMLDEQKSKNNGALVEKFQALYDAHQENLGALEQLTEKLLKWQEKYA